MLAPGSDYATMAKVKPGCRILIVDDESESAILHAVLRRVEEEGWETSIIEPEAGYSLGEEFEAATIYSIEQELPDAVLLDVRFGEHRDDQFRGLGILGALSYTHLTLPTILLV